MQTAVAEFVALLENRLDFAHEETSFSPHFSTGGLRAGAHAGAGELLFYYNRRTTEFGGTMLEVCGDGDGVARTALRGGPLGFEAAGTAGGTDRVAFSGPDVFTYESRTGEIGGGSPAWAVPAPGADGSQVRIVYDGETRVLLLEGVLPRSDPRDPEPVFPYRVAVRVADGVAHLAAGDRRWADSESVEVTTAPGGRVILGAAAADRPARFTVAFAAGDTDGGAVATRAAEGARHDIEDCQSRTVRWLEDSAPRLAFPETTEGLRRLYARCVWTLLSNTVRPHGRFGSFRGCYPNRARYCCHYLWDSCFQSFGMARINRELAAEALRLLAARQEEDGKIPQFLCATWNRPGAAQPPLIAWAAWRLFESTRDRSLLEDLYEPLERWNRWWFAQRDDDGDRLPEYCEGLESGWDNSPRWDHGRVEPLDLNSFLVVQMESLARFAKELGREADAERWSEEAARHAARVRERLWMPDAGLFFDVTFDSHEPVRIVTPACFLPVWAGVLPEPERLSQMIDGILLAPEHLGGDVPFPVVSRSEERYDNDGWWRGPVWMNIAHLMLETLRRTGRLEARRDAMRRLLAVVERNDDPRELYDSRSGDGLGAHELGWTASVAMLWIEELAKAIRAS